MIDPDALPETDLTSDSVVPSSGPGGVETDRRLCLAFIADPEARTACESLLGLVEALWEIPARVRDPMMGEMRLAWWQEAFDSLLAGEAGGNHPALVALAPVVRTHGLSGVWLSTLLDAVASDLAGGGFADFDAALAYVDQREVALSALGLHILAPGHDPHTIQAAARLYGLARLVGQGRMPRDAGLVSFLREARDVARRDTRTLPEAAFPWVAPATLWQGWLKGPPGPLQSRLKLTLAVATGRI
ncbi:MAG: squalene/phytoene synthase family protein [Asticcacaulis sp.]